MDMTGGVNTAIPLSGVPVNPMASLSSVLDVANKQNAFRAGQNVVQQSDINLQERQGAQGVLKNIKQYQDSQGNIDYNKLMPDIMAVAPTTGADVLNGVFQTQQSATAAKTAVNSLDTQTRGILGNFLVSMKGQPPEVVQNGLGAFTKTFPNVAPVGDFGWNHLLAPHVNDPKAFDNALDTLSRSVLSPQDQQTMNTPQGATVSSGTTTKQVNIKPGVSGMPQGATIPGTEVQQQVPPGQQESVGSDSQGNQFVTSKTPAGVVTGTRPLQSTSPGTQGPFNIPAGETADTLKQAQAIRAQSNQAAGTVPQVQFNSNQIIKLADETNTGKGAQILAGLGGQYAGIPWTKDSASNYNQLGHYMALQTAQLAQSTGIGGTDQGRGIAAEQAGTREWTADAIKSTARVNRALSTGADLFNRGVENAVQASSNPFAARDFQNKWSKVASVDAMRLADALKNKGDDPQGFAKTVQDLGGVGSAKYKATLSQMTEMRKLIRGE